MRITSVSSLHKLFYTPKNSKTLFFCALVRFGKWANVCIQYFCGFICSPLTSIFNWLMRPFRSMFITNETAKWLQQLEFWSITYTHIQQNNIKPHQHCTLITLQNNHLRMPNAMQCNTMQSQPIHCFCLRLCNVPIFI